MAADLGDGTAEGGSGEVVSGARMLKDQAMAADWSKSGRILGIKGQGFGRILKHKLLPFEGESRESNRGLLLLGVRGSFLEYLERFGASFEAVRSFAGKRR